MLDRVCVCIQTRYQGAKTDGFIGYMCSYVRTVPTSSSGILQLPRSSTHQPSSSSSLTPSAPSPFPKAPMGRLQQVGPRHESRQGKNNHPVSPSPNRCVPKAQHETRQQQLPYTCMIPTQDAPGHRQTHTDTPPPTTPIHHPATRTNTAIQGPNVPRGIPVIFPRHSTTALTPPDCYKTRFAIGCFVDTTSGGKLSLGSIELGHTRHNLKTLHP